MNREQSLSNKTADSSSQAPAPASGENAASHTGQPGPPGLQISRSRNQVFKSGPLFISSKGIGWTSWKKRWFILTRTSLVFFRTDPSIAPPKAGEMNLTLGGIDLNSSASVEVKVDKKLLTVLFPDGRDGRAFTLKAETSDDLHEWKTALETAVAQAPTTSAAGQKGVFNTEEDEPPNELAEQQNDRLPGKSMVIGRPVLLALEDIDGSPSFLEKALRFIEQHGVRVEGILRQAADVDHVYCRVNEYEQGKTEFSPGEDAHVIADCIKYILRELPSSPVPATCCTALLEAFRSDRNNRLNNMRTAILETFPEPNRRLLQRILLMMQHIAAHKTENRMSVSAVAACMSPLLLRPLLAGDCELENTHMDVAGDGSLQLLQAAAAANHAQAIVIILLEEYDNIFGEGSVSPEMFSDSDASYSGTEEGTDDDDDDYDDSEDDHDGASRTDSDYEHSGSETCSGSDSCDEKSDSSSSSSNSSSKSRQKVHHPQKKQRSPSVLLSHQNDKMQRNHSIKKQKSVKAVAEDDQKKSHRIDTSAETILLNESVCHSPKSGSQKASSKLLGSASQAGRPMSGQTPARKNLSMESIKCSLEDEEEIQRLEDAKTELENRIAEKTNHNATLRANLEKRKKDIHERRQALEKDVARLQDQLQKEVDIGAALESGDISHLLAGIDEKTKTELKEISLAEEKNNNLRQTVDDLGARVSKQHEKNSVNIQERGTRKQETLSRGTMSQNNKDNASKDTSSHVGKPSENETKAELKGTASAEEKNNNLKQTVDDLGARVNQQHEKNAVNIQERGTRKQETLSRGTMSQNNKDNASKDASLHVGKLSKNEGLRNNNFGGANHDKDGNFESPSLSNKNQNQLNDASRGGTYNVGSQPSNSSVAESSAPKSLNLGSSSKKSGKGEGGNPASSTLSKLTNRLNFLKERRNQIANELENLDKGRGSPTTQSMHSSCKGKSPEDKNQGREGGFVQNREDTSRQLSSHTSIKGTPSGRDNKDGNNKKGSGYKSDTLGTQNSDNGRKSESRPFQQHDKGQKPENQPSQQLDKGRKSEGLSSSRSAAKGRQQDSKHSSTSSSKGNR